MFLGQYQHTLDYKGRTSIPKKFRNEIKNKAFLTKGLDGCLFLYSQQDWEVLAARMEQLPLTGNDARSFSRYIFSGAVEVNFDRLGRISVPEYLRLHASLQKEIVIAGVLNRIEIWSKPNWEKFSSKLSTKSEEIAEKLSESGI